MKLIRNEDPAGSFIISSVIGLNLFLCMSAAAGQDDVWELQNCGVDVSLRGICAVSDTYCSRAVAMNINSGDAKLVLLCPAWKNWGTTTAVRRYTVILHSQVDDVIPFAASQELARNSTATLIEVGTNHQLSDPEPLAAMLKACGSR